MRKMARKESMFYALAAHFTFFFRMNIIVPLILTGAFAYLMVYLEQQDVLPPYLGELVLRDQSQTVYLGILLVAGQLLLLRLCLAWMNYVEVQRQCVATCEAWRLALCVVKTEKEGTSYIFITSHCVFD